MNVVEHQIQALLDRIERDHGVKILYACESGSRAWGFASPDSDYDIRFLFARPSSTYVSIQEGIESIDLPLEGDLDAGGWDLRKAARLLGKSNGALVEWLHSPIVYRAEPTFRERWQVTARDVFSARASCDHYRGLAKQMIRGKLDAEAVRAKDYLYALRAILAAHWVTEGRGIPPVEFSETLSLLPENIHALIPELLEHKARTGEGVRMPRITALDDYLQGSLQEIESKIPDLHTGPNDHGLLDRLLQAELRRNKPTTRLALKDFTLERVRQPDLLLFDSIAGSHAYGTAVQGSDQDRRGVFVAPPGFLLGLDTIEQVSDEKSDEVYYELGRFVDLLLKNNPNALELLGMPEDCIHHQHPLFSLLTPELFLSKLCAKTFGEYAMGQIRKARGLNKKIVNPQPEKRLGLLDFCHVPEGQGSVSVLDWLASRNIDPWTCGLTAVQHAAGMYAIYEGSRNPYRGLVSRKDQDGLIFSSVPKDTLPIAWMHCNIDAFKAHCKAHREYWEWVGLRNEERYRNNAQHGRGYDSKNLMHTLRLLDMASEIATEGKILIRRPNREYLLQVRAGDFAYDDLVARAEETLRQVEEEFAQSELPERPDRERANDVLLEIRENFQR